MSGCNVFIGGPSTVNVFIGNTIEVVTVASGPRGSRVVEIGGFFGGAIDANETLLRLELTAPTTLRPASSRASVGSNPIAPTSFALTFNGTALGSVLIATNGTATFDLPAQTIGPGLLRLTAPAALNGINDLSITLSGDR